MARTKRSSAATSRRTLAGLGTVGIVAGTIAIGAGIATAPAARAATASINYQCSLPDLGLNFKDPWVAAISVDLPAQADINSTLDSPKVTAKVSVGADAVASMRALKIKTLEGTASSTYSVTGDVVKPGTRIAPLTVPKTIVPDSGPVVNVASGTGRTETTGAKAGTANITVGNFTAQLTTDSGFVLNVSCTVDGSDKVGSVNVVDPSAPTSSPTSPTSTPTDTGTPTATATGTSTSTSTATSTATGTTSSTGVTGPPIITDGGSSDGGLNGGVLGGAAVAAAGVGALGFGLRRRLSSK